MKSTDIRIKNIKTIENIKTIIKLHKSIWGLDDFEITPPHIYKATLQTGGHILIAYKNKEPAGFIYGFPGFDSEGSRYFYIHNLGVEKKFRSLGIGLKLNFQLRKILLKESYNTVKWTFDPLESTNANLYIGKMGGIVEDYIKDYYGKMTDELNKNISSDRMIIKWKIKSSRVVEKLNSRDSFYTINDIEKSKCLNFISKDKKPKNNNSNSISDFYFLEIPANYHEIKIDSFDITREWRLYVRNILQSFLKKGFVIVDTVYYNKRFFYVLSYKNSNIKG